MNLISVNFFTGLLLIMNATDSFIGLMPMIALSANLLQVLSPLLLERFQRRKTLLITGRIIIWVINIVFIGLIPMLPGSNQLRFAIMGASVLLVNLLSAICSPGFTVWFISFIPENMRARFFSMTTVANGIVVTVAAIGAGALADYFKVHGMELTGLQAVRAIALIFAVIELTLIIKMTEKPYEETKEIKLKQLLMAPFQNRLYLRTVLIAFLWFFTANIPGPYYSIYLLKDLQVSYSFIMIMSIMNVPILVLFTPVWVRMLKRTSWFKILSMAMSFFLLQYVILAFITKPTVYYIYPIAVLASAIFTVGINFSMTNIPYINMPKDKQTLFIGFYAAAANLGALLGVSVGNGLYWLQRELR